MIKKPVLAVLGAVWAGQGIGWLPGSSMTGDRTWLLIGTATVVVGAVLVFLSTRGRSWHNPNGPSGQE
ncbi:hypothetical protein [Ruania alba]|uniref:Uncharacterized protein n=1 Tax=Ruania alba TaxID=648782 RepID=A0A1H5H450_9MICO|nr:hypothetical protein [Ruania alba]SEE22700.1 hypothetical protein SAMN04488554_1848 [Ruania alba]